MTKNIRGSNGSFNTVAGADLDVSSQKTLGNVQDGRSGSFLNSFETSKLQDFDTESIISQFDWTLTKVRRIHFSNYRSNI